MTAQPSSDQFLPSLQRTANQVFAPLQREFNRLFDQLGSGWETFTEFDMSPRIDVRETKGAVHISMELPGMTQDQVKIAIEGDVLTVSGEKTGEKDVKEAHRRIAERAYGAFSRSVLLPRSVDADKVKATMADGVLTIVAKKDGSATAKTIEIQSK